jgi:hypothetical protein
VDRIGLSSSSAGLRFLAPRRLLPFSERLDDLEAIQPRHMDVQEH